MSDPKTDLPNSNQDIEQNRHEQMEQIRLKLAGIAQPRLESVPATTQHERRVENGPILENIGYFEVLIDSSALELVLETCGVPKEIINQLSISIRPAMFADRNFVGGVIGGISYGDNTIELYSSLLANILAPYVDEAMKTSNLVSIPFKKEVFTKSLIHELRHIIQLNTGLFAGEKFDSFHVATDQAYYEDPAEIDAIAFSDLADVFSRFVDIRPYPGMQGIYEDASGHNLTSGKLQGLAKYLDVDHQVARVTHKDLPGGFLLAETQHLTESGNISDMSKVLSLIDRIQHAVNMRQLGHIEQHYLLTVVIYNQALDADNNQLIEFLEEWMGEREKKLVT